MTRIWIGALLASGCTAIERIGNDRDDLEDTTVDPSTETECPEVNPPNDTAPPEPPPLEVLGMWAGWCAWFEIDGVLPNGVPEFNLGLTGDADELAGFGTFASTNSDNIRTIVGFEADGDLVGDDLSLDLVFSNDAVLHVDGTFDEDRFEVVGSTDVQGVPTDLYRCSMRPY